MGVSVAVTRVAANTSTGTQDITTTDLGGLTPKAVLLIATRGTADGSATDGAGMYWGVSDGTNEWCQSYEDQHGQASMNNEDEQDTSSGRILTIYNGAANGTVDGAANFSSFISNGVRIDWVDAPAAGYLITAVLFAGTDLSANVGTADLGNTSNATVAITSVGFEADLLFTSILEGSSTQNPGWCFGFAQNDRAGNVSQRSVAHKNRDGFGSGFVAAVMYNTACITKILATDGLDWTGTATDFDSSGFDIQLGNSRPPGNHHIGWLALRFGSSTVVQSAVYTYFPPTSTGSATDNIPDFEPQFVMYLASRTAVANSIEADADGGTVSVVALTANALYTNAIASEDAAADSNSQSLSDDSLILTTHTGGSGHEATLTSLGSTGPVWNYSATDSTERRWAGLAIGVFEEEEEEPQTANVGQASETDEAHAIDRKKSRTTGQIAETDQAQALSTKKAKDVGQIAETETANPITPSKRRTTGQIAETDQAQAIARKKAKDVGQIAETEIANPITPSKRRTTGQAGETDQVQPVGTKKARTLDQISETETANPITPTKRLATGQAGDTETVNPVARRKLFHLGIAQETDTAITLGENQVFPVGRAIETDSAFPVARRKVKTLGMAIETNAVQPMARTKMLLLEQVEEDDIAQGLFPRKQVAIGQAIEVDSVGGIAATRKTRSLELAIETDIALPLEVIDTGIGRAIHFHTTARRKLHSTTGRRTDQTQRRSDER